MIYDINSRIHRAGPWSSMYCQYYCTGSTTALAEGAAKVANVLNVYVRPKITPVPGTSYIIAETHQNIRRRHRARLHNLSCLKNRLNPFLREARLNRYMAA